VLITLNNKYILKNHICCASKEKSLKIEEYSKFGVQNKNLFLECLEELVSESLLMKRGDRYFWNSDFFPNEKYGLNDLSKRSYKILLRTDLGEEFLTVEDESFVFRDLHQGAVYLYEAETYLVEELDLDERLVYLKRTNVDFYTQSLRHTDITPLEVISENKIGSNNSIEIFYGNVKVEHEYYSYKVVDTINQEIRSRHPLEDIPIVKFKTQAVWFFIPFEHQKELELERYNLGGTIHAIEHAMIAMAPALAQISRWDLGGISIDFDPVRQQPIIYIYDAYRGGIGISEGLYYNLNELLKITYTLVNTCSCKSPDGCPCCCLSPKCGNNNEPLDKEGAKFLLRKLIE
jgi:DEAD/DEAH box helicase domain-containing protein